MDVTFDPTKPGVALPEIFTATAAPFPTDSIFGIIYDTMTNLVVDSNVIVSALISHRGASFRLLSLIGTGRFDMSLSVPLVLEYEDAAKRYLGTKINLSAQDIDDVIDYLCSVATHHPIYYLWRPFLKDIRDDMVLELAVSANCEYIVTYNQRDFQGSEIFGVDTITPKILLEKLGVLS